MTVEERLKELGLQLPEAPGARGNYVSVQRTGNLLFFSGSGPILNGKSMVEGRVGAEVSVEDAYQAARLTALNLISILKREVGDLEKVVKIVKLLGFVASAPDFYAQPSVINGASDLFVEVFGERGKHARSAVATSVLPFNLPVEIEMIVEIRD